MVDTKAQLRKGTTKIPRQAATAATGVSTAAQSAAQGMQQAAEGVAAGLRAGTDSVRGWMAPRLESAADYTTSTAAPAVSKAVVKKAAPRISAALRTTAKQVRPASRRPAIRPALAWSALAATVLASAGAVAALLWRRRRGASADGRLDGVSYPDPAANTDGMAARATPSEDEVTPPVPDPAPTSW